MNNFCTDGELQNPKCYSVESVDFKSEENIYDILLDILKSELPKRIAEVKDCQDNPMYIAEEDIDLIPSGKSAHFSLLLIPFGDVPEYTESRQLRTVRHTFEALLTVENELLRCVTWELLRFKNVVESLIIGSEIYIDGYDSVFLEPDGFRYFIPDEGGVGYRHQGAYRFSVTVTQHRS